MIGVIANVLAVALGGIAGAIFGSRFNDKFTEALNSIFGICALGMGISSIGNMENMPAVMMAVILGTVIGLSIHLGEKISSVGMLLGKPLEMLGIGRNDKVDVSLLVTAMVLFCSSGTGIYGCIDAGMTGNATILLSKSVLDFFTAFIFACSLGAVTAIIAVPQIIIYTSLFMLASVIYPLTTPAMINDFKACGGFILLATGLRVAKVKEFPIADMIPAMIIVMPISAIWVNYIMPML
ncbi:MAG: DUF554 domain-containing protein [Eubacteriales bacterium]|nr:DUF554 domain-containing protein [Eubacteriales bacterium]